MRRYPSRRFAVRGRSRPPSTPEDMAYMFLKDYPIDEFDALRFMLKDTGKLEEEFLDFLTYKYDDSVIDQFFKPARDVYPGERKITPLGRQTLATVKQRIKAAFGAFQEALLV